MAIHNTPEERQIVKILEKLATPDAERQAWIDEIHTTGMSEELAEQIHQYLVLFQHRECRRRQSRSRSMGL